MHCLHEARGNVLEALELLRQGGPQPNEDHPLAGYHYPGMDTWTPLEQQLFDKAFRKYKNNFHQLQKETVCSPRKRHRVLPHESSTPKQQNRCQAPHQPSSAGEGSGFSCPECQRLFNTTQGRNSHMKIHRRQQKPPVLG
ncbi:zinc finger protein 541-like isoform 2-T2 [Ara ararauna]